MGTVRWKSGMMGATMVLALLGAQPGLGDVASDRAAAIVMYPNVFATGGILPFLPADTIIQISNTSSQPVLVHCFYENANSHCSNTGEICFDFIPGQCCTGDSCGTCDPGWNEVDFLFRLTPFQPLGWRASEGLADFPLDGVNRVGIGGSANTGSRIPALPELPFDGMLKCVAVNEDGTPSDRNVLKGESTLVTLPPGGDGMAGDDAGRQINGESALDVAKHNAIGIQAIEGAVNQDNVLVLGGPEAEYNGCSEILILDHLFDGAESPVHLENEAGARIATALVLVPCTQDLLRQIPGSTVVQFLVYNEFEQRFSTSTTVDCKFSALLSSIDTSQGERSIFSVGVAGTLSGQTRIHPLNVGLVGIASEVHGFNSAEFHLHKQGEREESDTITLP